MRSIATIVAALFLTSLSATSSAQTTYQQSYVCPKCGKTHVRTVSRPISTGVATSATNNTANERVTVRKVSYPAASGSPVASSSTIRATSGVKNVLAALNAQRSRQGVGTLLYDGQLQAVAERRAQQMAASGLKNHPPGSFAPGRYEGVGWSSSYSPSGVSACFTSDSRMRYAGAAMATGRDGVYFAVVYR